MKLRWTRTTKLRGTFTVAPYAAQRPQKKPEVFRVVHKEKIMKNDIFELCILRSLILLTFTRCGNYKPKYEYITHPKGHVLYKIITPVFSNQNIEMNIWQYIIRMFQAFAEIIKTKIGVYNTFGRTCVV